ncbi:MAG TPA: HU family DNA-binding protein [Leptolyngbyaceae cyanobacterium M33_DOE_097]|uniref:HU family DNA-binding protein n=1 Tax=Oscillatoriales cyanobacterium SpSt-418 TaxID=2282169 RepID=A0A7C3KH50_9CYAN|nr:HU family DNA-binding protein [Leptolyngbyaceae cyanobacterium M33_DOE_097]
MNKAELINAVNKETGVHKGTVDKVITSLLSQVQAAVATGDEVVLVGFGTFKAKERAERQGHNPQNGEPITIPAALVPTFKAGKTFKEVVKG